MASPTNEFAVYVHMEKCGGMSLHHALRYSMPGYVILRPWWYWSNEPGNFFSSAELRWLRRLQPRLRGIGGHTTRSYANYEHVVGPEVFYFTFLREPISRYFSHLNHQVNKMKIAWSVEDFLREEKFCNLMTRRLAGTNDVELAKRRLTDDFGMVGLFEAYDESLLVLSTLLFGVPDALPYEHMNDSAAESKIRIGDLSPELQARARENNALDIELYEHVKAEIFPRYLACYPGDIGTDVVRFRKVNQSFSYDTLRWNLQRLAKVYSERICQPIAHRASRWTKG